MQKNETVLTPLYRHIFGIIESNGKEGIAESLKAVSAFCTHWSCDMGEMGSASHSFPILKECQDLLESYKEDIREAEKLWMVQKKKIEKRSCDICYPCQKCQLYFWEELGEIFFGYKNKDKEEKKYLPLRKLPDKISRHLEPSVGVSELYCVRAGRKSQDLNNKLIILKGMSSSTPTMLNSVFDTDEFDGGGFFFQFKGYGVAIDPGYHFMRNLHHYGLSVLDIDAVVITHEHIDHNNDMRLMDDIHFSVARHGREQEDIHIIKWYLDEVSFEIAKVLQKSKSGFNEETNELYCIKGVKSTSEVSEHENYVMGKNIHLSKEVLFHTFETQHIYNKDTFSYYPHTFGCKFVIKDETDEKVLVYTSDTRFFPEMVKEIQGADILIANISGIYEDDYMLVKQKTTHLGYYGCYNLIREYFHSYWKYPKFLLISEFWNGKSDIRYDIASQLSADFRDLAIGDIKVLPAENGMVLDISSLKVQCSQCSVLSDKIVVKKPRGIHGKIDVFCENCYY